MFRRQLDADAGMLFLFDRPQPLSFWMRNTYISLDMIFITEELRVLGVVERTEPMSERACSVEGDAQYVLEVPAGFAAQHGITAGTRVSLSGIDTTKEAP